MFAGEGEPLLHPDLPEIINHTKSMGIDVAITTNGVALTRKFVDSCLEHITWIKVSMNGGSKSYEQIHKAKAGDYEKVWANLSYAREKRREGTAIGVQCVLLPENTQDIQEPVQRARDIGLDYAVIKPYSQHKSSITREYEDISYSGYQDLLAVLEDCSTSNFEVVARKRSMANWDSEQRHYSKCYSTPYFWAYIMATGDVYGCSAYLLDSRFLYGNILQQSFSDIWLGDKRKASQEYVENGLDITECRKNCRMDKVNQFLWDVKNPGSHANFI